VQFHFVLKLCALCSFYVFFSLNSKKNNHTTAKTRTQI
jgi:hypothetical protein